MSLLKFDGGFMVLCVCVCVFFFFLLSGISTLTWVSL